MQAKRTRRSPAGPMAITSASPPSASSSAWTVSRVVLPMRRAAGLISAPVSVTHRYDGAGAAPLMHTASKPVRLSVAGQRPPNVESKKSPVSGDFAATQPRLLPGTVVSVIGPTLNTTAFAGSKASVRAGTRS